MDEVQELALIYLKDHHSGYDAFNITNNISMSIAREINPIDPDIGLHIGGRFACYWYQDPIIFKSVMKDWDITIEDLKFKLEEEILKQL